MKKTTYTILSVILLSSAAFAQEKTISSATIQEFSDYTNKIHSFSNKRLNLEAVKIRAGMSLVCGLRFGGGAVITGTLAVAESLPVLPLIFEDRDNENRYGGDIRNLGGGILSEIGSAAVDGVKSLIGDQSSHQLKKTATYNYVMTRESAHKYFVKKESMCGRAQLRIGAIQNEINSRNLAAVASSPKVSATSKIKRSLGFAVTASGGSSNSSADGAK